MNMLISAIVIEADVGMFFVYTWMIIAAETVHIYHLVFCIRNNLQLSSCISLFFIFEKCYTHCVVITILSVIINQGEIWNETI